MNYHTEHEQSLMTEGIIQQIYILKIVCDFFQILLLLYHLIYNPLDNFIENSMYHYQDQPDYLLLYTPSNVLKILKICIHCQHKIQS